MSHTIQSSKDDSSESIILSDNEENSNCTKLPIKTNGQLTYFKRKFDKMFEIASDRIDSVETNQRCETTVLRAKDIQKHVKRVASAMKGILKFI